MIGAAIGAGIGVLGSIFGGVKASQAAKARKENIERRKSENDAWFNRSYNEDATQRHEAQLALTRLNEQIRERNRAARGRQVVTGGTEESVAATKAANAGATAQAVSDITAAADARKDAIEESYRERNAALDDQLNNIETQRAQGVSQAIQGVAGAAGGLGMSLDDYLDSRNGLKPANKPL